MKRGNTWYTYCHKNIFMDKLYGKDIPALENVDIRYINMTLTPDDRMVASAQIAIRLNALPEDVPVKWRKNEVNCVEIKIEIIEIDSVSIKSNTSGKSNVIVCQDSEYIMIRFSGAIMGVIKCPLEYKQTLESGMSLIDNKCFAITEIKGIHED